MFQVAAAAPAAKKAAAKAEESSDDDDSDDDDSSEEEKPAAKVCASSVSGYVSVCIPTELHLRMLNVGQFRFCKCAWNTRQL